MFTRAIHILLAAACLTASSVSAEPVLDTVRVHQPDGPVILTPDRPFSESAVTSLADSILYRWQQRGHYYATLGLRQITRSDSSVTLEFDLSPGPLVTIDDLAYLGLERTRPTAIARYLPVSAGDTLTDDRIAAVERAADRIPFVRFLSPAIVRPQAGYTSTDIELTFREQRPLTLEIGGGYIPGDSDQYVWDLNARFNNLFGGGRRARLVSERREEGRQILQIGYAQPWFLIGAGDLAFEVATRDYRESFYEFTVNAAYTTLLRDYFTAGLALAFKSVEPNGPAASFSSYSIGFSAGWDQVDTRFNPSAGFRVATAVDYRYRRYADDSTAVRPPDQALTETRTELRAALFQPLIRPLVGHLGLHYEGLETSEDLPPLSELVLVGGPGSLRGYRNEQFAVIRAAILTVEPRVRFNSGFLFAFYDAAYLNNRLADGAGGVRTEEDYRFGYGLGLGLFSEGRGVQVALGWNPDINFDQPRLSIELITDI